MAEPISTTTGALASAGLGVLLAKFFGPHISEASAFAAFVGVICFYLIGYKPETPKHPATHIALFVITCVMSLYLTDLSYRAITKFIWSDLGAQAVVPLSALVGYSCQFALLWIATTWKTFDPFARVFGRAKQPIDNDPFKGQ